MLNWQSFPFGWFYTGWCPVKPRLFLDFRPENGKNSRDFFNFANCGNGTRFFSKIIGIRSEIRMPSTPFTSYCKQISTYLIKTADAFAFDVRMIHIALLSQQKHSLRYVNSLKQHCHRSQSWIFGFFSIFSIPYVSCKSINWDRLVMQTHTNRHTWSRLFESKNQKLMSFNVNECFINKINSCSLWAQEFFAVLSSSSLHLFDRRKSNAMRWNFST